MAEITAAAVGQLRKRTNAGLMDCKKALTEAEGDMEKAIEILRKKGVASAAKKAGREAAEGRVAIAISDDRKSGALVEVNCETDFVAKNATFEAFCDEIAKKVLADPKADLEANRTEAVAKIGENILVGRSEIYSVAGNGSVAGYIHTGAKVGVLLQLETEKAETLETEAFQQLCRDLTLQIAAASPETVTRDEVDPAIVEKEKEIFAEQMKDKPAAAIENIVKGKLEKFYQTNCLVDQGFVKANGEISIGKHIESVGKELGDSGIRPVKFARVQIGG